MNDIPFYIGMTNNPLNRYKRHYHYPDCNTYNFIRHKALVEGKMMEMKIVYCSPDKDEVGRMEEIGIKALRNNGFITYNRTVYNRTSELITSDYPNIKKFPHHILTFDILKHVIDNTLNILTEYGYEEYRHQYMGYAESISRRIRNKRSKGS